MFLWSTGALNQTDWNIVQHLWPPLCVGLLLTGLLLRPLTLIGLDDSVASNLSLALSLVRFATLALAIIGFIGMFALLLAKMLGARCLLPRLLLAASLGVLILWIADQSAVWLAGVWIEFSTGSITALIGVPLLLWLVPRLRDQRAPLMRVGDGAPAKRQARA